MPVRPVGNVKLVDGSRKPSVAAPFDNHFSSYQRVRVAELFEIERRTAGRAELDVCVRKSAARKSGEKKVK